MQMLCNMIICVIKKKNKQPKFIDTQNVLIVAKEMGIPDHLTCFLRNLYAGQKQQLEQDME